MAPPPLRPQLADTLPQADQTGTYNPCSSFNEAPQVRGGRFPCRFLGSEGQGKCGHAERRCKADEETDGEEHDKADARAGRHVQAEDDRHGENEDSEVG